MVKTTNNQKETLQSQYSATPPVPLYQIVHDPTTTSPVVTVERVKEVKCPSKCNGCGKCRDCGYDIDDTIGHNCAWSRGIECIVCSCIHKRIVHHDVSRQTRHIQICPWY